MTRKDLSEPQREAGAGAESQPGVGFWLDGQPGPQRDAAVHTLRCALTGSSSALDTTTVAIMHVRRNLGTTPWHIYTGRYGEAGTAGCCYFERHHVTQALATPSISLLGCCSDAVSSRSRRRVRPDGRRARRLPPGARLPAPHGAPGHGAPRQWPGPAHGAEPAAVFGGRRRSQDHGVQVQGIGLASGSRLVERPRQWPGPAHGAGFFFLCPAVKEKPGSGPCGQGSECQAGVRITLTGRFGSV